MAEAVVAYSMGRVDQTEQAKTLHSVLETITLILYVFPFAMGAWDLFEIRSSRCYRCFRACVYKVVMAAHAATAFVCQDNTAAALSATRNVARAERIQKRNTAIVIKLKDNTREAKRDERRSHILATLLSDLRPLAECAAASAAHTDAHHRGRVRNRSRQTEDGDDVTRTVDAYNDAIDAASEALDLFPLALAWNHFIAAESAARKLSKLVFGGQIEGNGRRRAESRLSSQGNQRGVVLLAFSNVHALWRQEIARNLCAQEADGNDTSTIPSMKSATICRNAIIALLCPGAQMGSFRMAGSAMARVGSRLALSEEGGSGSKRNSQRDVVLRLPVADSEKVEAKDGDGGGGGGGGGRRGATKTSPKRSAVVPAGIHVEENPVFNPVRLDADPTDDLTEGVETKVERLARLAPQHREAALEALQVVDHLNKAAMEANKAAVEASQRLECLLLAGQPPPVQVVRSTDGREEGDGSGGEGWSWGNHLMVARRNTCTATPVSLPPLRSSLSALRFASPALRNDVHVVMAAVQKDGQALEYASAELQGHPGVVLAAVQQGGATQSVDPPPEADTRSALPYQTGGGDDVRVMVSVVHRAEYEADDESSVEMAC